MPFSFRKNFWICLNLLNMYLPSMRLLVKILGTRIREILKQTHSITNKKFLFNQPFLKYLRKSMVLSLFGIIPTQKKVLLILILFSTFHKIMITNTYSSIHPYRPHSSCYRRTPKTSLHIRLWSGTWIQYPCSRLFVGKDFLRLNIKWEIIS